MELVFEKSYDVIIYPSNMKCYVFMSKSGKVEIKGLGFSKYSLEYRQQLRGFFKMFLTNVGVHSKSIQELCD